MEQSQEHWNDPYLFVKILKSCSSVSFQSFRNSFQRYRDYFGRMVILLITHVKTFTIHTPLTNISSSMMCLERSKTVIAIRFSSLQESGLSPSSPDNPRCRAGPIGKLDGQPIQLPAGHVALKTCSCPSLEARGMWWLHFSVVAELGHAKTRNMHSPETGTAKTITIKWKPRT